MLCQNCNKRKATEKWIGEGSVMDYIHGNYQWWCKRCILEYQLKYAKRIAKNIPKLIKQLKKERGKFDEKNKN